MRSEAQEESSYQFLPAPDLWYNDVDGIRTGIRLKGRVPGTFDEGPHRLDFGVWLGTWIPADPVSYYLSFTEPFPSLSDFGSEANIRVVSSIRTGFQKHGLSFNKRWQKGFEERNYRELSLNVRVEDRFDSEYLLYPRLWSGGTLYLTGLDIRIHNENSLGRYSIETSTNINVAGSRPFFATSFIELQYHIPLSSNFALRVRNFTGWASDDTDTQYLFSRSFKPARLWMNNGLTRAKGTIPTPWMEEGLFQIAGGANLRGYLDQEIETLNDPTLPPPVFKSMESVNVELDYPNPLDQAIRNTPFIGELMRLRSYLFFDTGTSLGFTDREEERLLSDLGTGLMLVIDTPDTLGKTRGIMIRYDLPLWLSDPSGGSNFEFRNIIGIGAVISL